MVQALYVVDGDRFIPRPDTGSPWSVELQHGGPPLGLLARCVELEASADLVPARLSVDLCRPVPRRPLGTRVECVRRGRRLELFEAALVDADREVAVARGLFLRPGGEPETILAPSVGDPPESLAPSALMPERSPGSVPDGFHTAIEVRWLPRQEGRLLGAWLRMPMSLVRGEECSGFQRLAALSDFANALTMRARALQDGSTAGFINADCNLHLWRRPVGEWFSLQIRDLGDRHGLGVSHAFVGDRDGPLGHCLQSRLAQPIAPGLSTRPPSPARGA